MNAPSTPAMRPAVSVVVPHYNQQGLLKKCLASLAAQTFPRSDFEVIVADNGPAGGIDDIISGAPDVIFVHAPARGAAHARNAALTRARGAAIAFIDADCVAEPDWLKSGLDALNAADLVGGRIIVTVKDEERPSPVEAFEQVFAFRQRDYVERKNFSATANLFASRAAVDAIGPFTNGISEDVDWCRRGAALGFHLAFNDKSIVRHPARRDWGELVRKWDRIIAERWAGFEGEGLFQRARWIALAVVTAASAAPHMARVLTSAELKTARDRKAAALVLAKIRWWRAVKMASLLRAE